MGSISPIYKAGHKFLKTGKRSVKSTLLKHIQSCEESLWVFLHSRGFQHHVQVHGRWVRFLHPQAKLVVEAMYPYPSQQFEARDKWLAEHGYLVKRFQPEQMKHNPTILNQIDKLVAERERIQVVSGVKADVLAILDAYNEWAGDKQYPRWPEEKLLRKRVAENRKCPLGERIANSGVTPDEFTAVLKAIDDRKWVQNHRDFHWLWESKDGETLYLHHLLDGGYRDRPNNRWSADEGI